MPVDSEEKDDKTTEDHQTTQKAENARQVLKQRQINLSSHTLNRPAESSFLSFDSSWQDFFDSHIDNGPDYPNRLPSHHIQRNANTNTSQHAVLLRDPSSEPCRALDRPLEKERRVRTDLPPSRPAAKGMFGEDFPAATQFPLPRNGFRPGTRHPYFSKNEQPLIATSYRYGNPKDCGGVATAMHPTGATSSTTALQGYRVGFGCKEAQSRPAGGQRGQRALRSSAYSVAADRVKGSRHSYQDPVQGAFPSFQQRLIEIAILEGDTIRYERTRKVKKKAKQDK